MREDFDIREQQLSKKERDFENALRPLNFSDFNGQDKVVDNLRIFVKAARLRAEALDHLILSVEVAEVQRTQGILEIALLLAELLFSDVKIFLHISFLERQR